MDTSSTSNDNTPYPHNLDTAHERYGIHMPDVGQVIGHNKILERIAEGGMANVYKVWHEELEIVRALKILKPGFDEESKKRLRTEAKISAHLVHPNIVEIYGVHFWNENVPYLEMEFVDGPSLKGLITRENRLPYTFATALVHHICTALHYAHNQVFTLYGKSYEGIVHRDIKPANILLTRTGVPKLADFGIAKPLDISLHTVGQKVMGTFAYLSPEQLKGETLDRRSDIYSLGIVIYECITGQKAFPQKTLADLIRDKLKNEYPPIGSFGVAIPKRLESAIEKSMEINRDKRYGDAEEFAADLLDIVGKSTSDTARQVLANFFTGNTTSTAVKKVKRPFFTPRMVFLLVSILLAITSAILIADAIITKRKAKAPVAAVNNVPAQAVTAKTGVKDDPFVALEEITPLATGQAKKTRTEKKKPASGQDLSQALGKYKEEKYKDAIPFFEAAMAKQLPDSTHKLATVCLLDCYLATKSFDNAQKLVASASFSDGYLFLLSGKVFFKINLPVQAAEQFFKAKTTPSRYKPDIAKESAYWCAKSLDAVFSTKPNLENKRAALKAWQYFAATFCQDADHLGMCKEANEGVESLSQ
jgi:serine/threonine protein kinase